MRYLLLGLCLLLPFLSFTQEDIEYKEYSYTEFFQMIEDTQDTIVRLNNIIVRPNLATDQDYATKWADFREGNFGENLLKAITEKRTVVSKYLDLTNIIFIPMEDNLEGNIDQDFIYGLSKIDFEKLVNFTNVKSLIVVDSYAKGGFQIRQNSDYKVYYDRAEETGMNSFGIFLLRNSFNKYLNIFSRDDAPKTQYLIHRNKIEYQNEFSNRNIFHNYSSFDYRGNQISGKNFFLGFKGNDFVDITNNIFDTDVTTLEFDTSTGAQYNFSNNKVTGIAELSIKPLSPELHDIEWEQFEGKIFDSDAIQLWNDEAILGFSDFSGQRVGAKDLSFFKAYEADIISNTVQFRRQMNLLGSFNQYYRARHNTESANEVYMALKDLETERLAFLHEQEKTFKSFFTWKINQFLKIFSAYGTEPARAIVFSIWVILAFALIYLFFPNHWDSHGKNRIMDRYRFFTKYMKQDSGMHEVYLEEKNQELMASEDFRTYMLESEKGIPKFFMATALPLYRWSVAGTKSFSWLLSKVDVLKGKWSDTEDAKKGGKTVLLISAFLISLTYDIFIKMLNALMLSINTFTTLGFGEIPIKGLPRYLAIIQGFIGWFMLTIFSVSLISQLLN